jgi:hypothetical protein
MMNTIRQINTRLESNFLRELDHCLLDLGVSRQALVERLLAEALPGLKIQAALQFPSPNLDDPDEIGPPISQEAMGQLVETSVRQGSRRAAKE